MLMNPKRRSLLHSDVDSMGPEMRENYKVPAKEHTQFVIGKYFLMEFIFRNLFLFSFELTEKLNRS